MFSSILVPAAVLVMWSLVMLIWMAVTRFPSMAKSGMDLSKLKPGGRGDDLNGILPDKVMWKAHNYSHLMEQPTIFYATIFILYLSGQNQSLVMYLAWAYVVLRIIHSIWQATVNTVAVRFPIFLASTICLVALSSRALIGALNSTPLT